MKWADKVGDMSSFFLFRSKGVNVGTISVRVAIMRPIYMRAVFRLRMGHFQFGHWPLHFFCCRLSFFVVFLNTQIFFPWLILDFFFILFYTKRWLCQVATHDSGRKWFLLRHIIRLFLVILFSRLFLNEGCFLLLLLPSRFFFHPCLQRIILNLQLPAAADASTRLRHALFEIESGGLRYCLARRDPLATPADACTLDFVRWQ